MTPEVQNNCVDNISAAYRGALTHESRNDELDEIRYLQPYLLALFEDGTIVRFKGAYDGRPPKMILCVDENVFPPDFGITSSQIAAVAADRYSDRRNVLEMGCGTGFPGLWLAASSRSIRVLTLVDVLSEAVQCTEKNARSNRHLFPPSCEITALKSDMFAAVPADQRWDLVIHNQTFYPDNGRFGLFADGGEALTVRFLTQVRDRLSSGGVVLMSFASFVDARHDPKPIAERLGYEVRTVSERKSRGGSITAYVYEISRR